MTYSHGPQALAIFKTVVSFAHQAVNEPQMARDRLGMTMAQVLGVPG